MATQYFLLDAAGDNAGIIAGRQFRGGHALCPAAWLNGDSVPRTSAVFSGDLVQTKADAVVHINATGSS
ncbi:MAG: hypothetical protein DMG84_22485, partial [Acidobacteria bacterium]